MRIRPGRWRQEIWINVLIIFLRLVQVIQAGIPVTAGEQCSFSSMDWYCFITLRGDDTLRLQGQMVTQLPIKLWPCPSSMVQLRTLERTAIYSATASAEDTGSWLVYFYFYLILDYARHSFLPIQGIHHFYNGKQGRTCSISDRLTLDLNWNTAVNHATWFYSGMTEYLLEQYLCTMLVLSFSDTGVNQYKTFCRPPQCQPSHAYTYAVSQDLLWLLHGWNNQKNSVLFLHFRIQRIFKDSARTLFWYLKVATPNTTELYSRKMSLHIID